MTLTRPREATPKLSIAERLAQISDPLERTTFIREHNKELADFVQLPPETRTLSAVLVTEFKQLTRLCHNPRWPSSRAAVLRWSPTCWPEEGSLPLGPSSC